MKQEDELQATIADVTKPGKGILAADESLPTISKRFKAVGIDCTDETRRAYRSLLITTPGAEQFLSGVILFEETLEQNHSAQELFGARGCYQQRSIGAAERLKAYKSQGMRFAKWREVYGITEQNPTPLGIEANAEVLARYAALCQAEGIVPIVEPEVLIDGEHSIERCYEVTEAVLHAVFHALYRHQVMLEYIVLKPNMVLPGKEHRPKASSEEVAAATVKVLRRTVPAAVPSINFLSGGQAPEEATANLNAINVAYPQAPWVLSFSYARALQDPVMHSWAGRPENRPAAQQAFARRIKMNSLARQGKWSPEMERAA